MTVTTKGFQGTISDTDMATQFVSLPGAVFLPADLAVTAVAGNRQVSVAPGTAVAHFVKYASDAAQLVTLSPPTSGGKWYAIAIDREWSPLNTATLVAVDTGITTDGTVPTTIAAVLTAGGPNAALPGWLKNSPGTAGAASNAAVGAHQVLAFVHVRAADTTLTVFGVRLINGSGGPSFAENLHALAWHAVVAGVNRGTQLPVGPHTLGGESFQAATAINQGGGAYVLSGRVFTGAATLGGLGAALKALLFAYSATSRIYGEGLTTGRIGLAFLDVATNRDYAWNGADWTLWGADVTVGAQPGGASGIGLAGTVVNFSNGSIDTRATRAGVLVTLYMGVNVGTNGMAAGGVVLSLPAGFAPPRTVHFEAMVFDQGGTGYGGQNGTFTVENNGAVYYQGQTGTANGTAIAANKGIFGSVTYRTA